MLKIKDINEFFETISKEKDIIKFDIEKVENIVDFFKGKQRENFDNARKAVMFYVNNKDYAEESEELKQAVKNITDILELDEPYSEIPKLPEYRNNLNNILGEMYDRKSKPIIALANETIKYIENEIKNSGVDSNFGDSYITTLKNTIVAMETLSELKDIYAKETYIHQLANEFDRDLEREKRKNELNDKDIPVIIRKEVSAKSLLNRSYEINSEQDIDKYISDLKIKLIEELKESNNLIIR